MKRIAEQRDNPTAGVGPRRRDDTRKSDSLSRKGATELARRLQDHWHDKGYPAARFWVEPITERFDKIGTREIHRVTCNFMDGLPPRYRG